MQNKNFINNICFLRKSRNIKVSELEEMVGVSSGYFSRLAKSPSSFPGIDILLKLSNIFRISVNILVSNDVCKLGADKITVAEFIEELKNRTLDNTLNWCFATSSLATIKRIRCVDENLEELNKRVGGRPLVAQYRKDIEVKIVPYEMDTYNGSYSMLEIYLVKGKRNIFVCKTDELDYSIQCEIAELNQIIMKKLTDSILTNEARDVLNDLLKK